MEKGAPVTEETEKKSYAWVETACAILMAVASLGTAWTSYEVSRWAGRSGEKAGASAALERKANLMRIEGFQVQGAQLQVFLEYVAAHMSGNAALEHWFVDRFPPELKKAFDTWIAQKPFENAGAPLHPFLPGIYEMRFTKEIEESLKESARLADDSRTAGVVASSYLSTTIVLATVLFFEGITARLGTSKLRLGTFWFGAVLFLISIVRVVTLPWMA
jgi:hypothetical protein